MFKSLCINFQSNEFVPKNHQWRAKTSFLIIPGHTNDRWQTREYGLTYIYRVYLTLRHTTSKIRIQNMDSLPTIIPPLWLGFWKENDSSHPFLQLTQVILSMNPNRSTASWAHLPPPPAWPPLPPSIYHGTHRLLTCHRIYLL